MSDNGYIMFTVLTFTPFGILEKVPVFQLNLILDLIFSPIVSDLLVIW